MTRHGIPSSFPVLPLLPNDAARSRATCGTCGRSWDDAIPTSYTPTPSARCPFEEFHGVAFPVYRFTLGRWFVSTDGGLSWNRTPYNVQEAPEPQYRDSNPKIDLYAEGGRYVGSTNWHRTCRDAFAWFATNRPEKGVTHVSRDNR